MCNSSTQKVILFQGQFICQAERVSSLDFFLISSQFECTMQGPLWQLSAPLADEDTRLYILVVCSLSLLSISHNSKGKHNSSTLSVCSVSSRPSFTFALTPVLSPFFVASYVSSSSRTRHTYTQRQGEGKVGTWVFTRGCLCSSACEAPGESNGKVCSEQRQVKAKRNSRERERERGEFYLNQQD